MSDPAMHEQTQGGRNPIIVSGNSNVLFIVKINLKQSSINTCRAVYVFYKTCNIQHINMMYKTVNQWIKCLHSAEPHLACKLQYVLIIV